MKKAILCIFWCLNAHAASFGVLGDAGVSTNSTRTVRASILRSGVTDLILPGDNLYFIERDTYASVWDSWRDLGLEFSVVALGNHTISNALEMDYFDMPGEFYRRDVQGVRFLVLNSDNVRTAALQAGWLKKELEAGKGHPNLFVVMHHPPMTLSPRHTWQERQAFHLAVRPVLLSYQDDIRAVLVGHDHLATFVMLENLPVVVSGAGFESFPAPPVNADVTPGGPRARTIWGHRAGNYWTRLDVNEKTGEVWFNFVHSAKGVDCSIGLRRSSVAPGQVVTVRPNCLASSF